MCLIFFYHSSPSISVSYLPLTFPKILGDRLREVKTIEKPSSGRPKGGCGRLIVDCSQSSISRIFIRRSLNARIESRENWAPAQNGRLYWIGGGDRDKFSILVLARFTRKPNPHPIVLRALFARFFFHVRKLKGCEQSSLIEVAG